MSQERIWVLEEEVCAGKHGKAEVRVGVGEEAEVRVVAEVKGKEAEGGRAAEGGVRAWAS